MHRVLRALDSALAINLKHVSYIVFADDGRR
jgi:hypothetical protein